MATIGSATLRSHHPKTCDPWCNLDVACSPFRTPSECQVQWRNFEAKGSHARMPACNNDNSVPFRLCRASAPIRHSTRPELPRSFKVLARFEVFEFDERYLSWTDSQLANSLWVFGWNLLFLLWRWASQADQPLSKKNRTGAKKCHGNDSWHNDWPGEISQRGLELLHSARPGPVCWKQTAG